MKNDSPAEKLELTYPRPWEYTVIGADADRLADAVAAVVGDRAHTLRPAHTSRTGKYSSLRLELIVDDEADRNAVFAALTAHEAVKIVL